MTSNPNNRLIWLVCTLAFSACGGASSRTGERADAQAPVDAFTGPQDGSLPFNPRYDVQPSASCMGLFGRPNESSGLEPGQCTPVCTCGEEPWSPPEYSTALIESLKTWVLVEPFAQVTSDPYAQGTPAPEQSGVVCGVLPEAGTERRYRLVDYESPERARAARAFITHTGACGVCSTLTDLSVYIANQDLTKPVRQCGLDHAAGSQADHVACLQKLGFTLPCAQIWYFNTKNTGAQCSALCLSQLNAPFHKPDGSLNSCLQCDEDKSGPVFKAVGGRTRRNSGLANALCRPCSDVSRVEHRYE